MTDDDKELKEEEEKEPAEGTVSDSILDALDDTEAVKVEGVEEEEEVVVPPEEDEEELDFNADEWN